MARGESTQTLITKVERGKTRPYGVKPLAPGSKELTLEVQYETADAIQFEFYVPAAVWSHRAVRAFIARLNGIEPGATILKTALGVWKDETEDTNIYRMIVGPAEGQSLDCDKIAKIRMAVREAVGEMMVALAEWVESHQEVFFFTDAPLILTKSSIIETPAFREVKKHWPSKHEPESKRDRLGVRAKRRS